MAFWYLNIAAFIAAVGAVFHGYVGGRIYLGHINGSDLEDLTKSLSVVSWQVFTIWLAVSAGVLVCVSLDASLGLMVYPIIAVNALCALLFVFLGFTGHGQLLKLPGAYLTGATAGLAYLGVG
jgi:hypothetical protein